MPLNKSLKKVMVIGSGPIVIGQAAEFDYAGTQACRALKEEGLEVVLVNSNPATIMTDSAIADHVYIEPLTTAEQRRICINGIFPDGYDKQRTDTHRIRLFLIRENIPLLAPAYGIPHPDRVLCRRTARSRIADHPPDQTSVRRRNAVVIVDI